MFNLEQAIADWRQKMLAAGIETPVPLEELELHLREEIEQQVRGGAEGKEAFEKAVKCIGDRRTLKVEFKKAGTIKRFCGYRLYDTMLTVFLLYTILTTLVTLVEGWETAGPLVGFWLNLAVVPELYQTLILRSLWWHTLRELKEWALWQVFAPDYVRTWVHGLNGIYILGMAATLFARQYRPRSALRWARLLNYALLPAFPFGTSIGLYGLWRAELEKYNEADKSWPGRLIVFIKTPVYNHQINFGSRLLAAILRVTCGMFAGLVGGITFLNATLFIAATLGFGTPVYDDAKLILAYLVIDLMRLILGAWMIWCARQIFRCPQTQQEMAYSHV